MTNEIKKTPVASGRFLRFLISGGVNTLFGFTVFCAAIAAGAAAWMALMVSLVAGIFFNFFTTGWYVFRDPSLSRLPRFVLCYLTVYTVNLLLLEWLSNLLGSEILSQAILVFPVATFTYVLMVRIAFKNHSREKGAQS